MTSKKAPKNTILSGAPSFAAGEHPEHLLSAYLFGDLSPGGVRAVEAHLESCAVCRGELDELRDTLEKVDDALRAEEDVDASASSETGCGVLSPERFQQVIAVGRRRGQRRWSPLVIGSALSSVAALVLIAMMWWNLDAERSAPEELASAPGADYMVNRFRVGAGAESADESATWAARGPAGGENRPGDVTVVEESLFRGNLKTQDRVVRRELELAPGGAPATPPSKPPAPDTVTAAPAKKAEVPREARERLGKYFRTLEDADARPAQKVAKAPPPAVVDSPESSPEEELEQSQLAGAPTTTAKPTRRSAGRMRHDLAGMPALQTKGEKLPGAARAADPAATTEGTSGRKGGLGDDGRTARGREIAQLEENGRWAYVPAKQPVRSQSEEPRPAGAGRSSVTTRSTRDGQSLFDSFSKRDANLDRRISRQGLAHQSQEGAILGEAADAEEYEEDDNEIAGAREKDAAPRSRTPAEWRRIQKRQPRGGKEAGGLVKTRDFSAPELALDEVADLNVQTGQESKKSKKRGSRRDLKSNIELPVDAVRGEELAEAEVREKVAAGYEGRQSNKEIPPPGSTKRPRPARPQSGPVGGVAGGGGGQRRFEATKNEGRKTVQQKVTKLSSGAPGPERVNEWPEFDGLQLYMETADVDGDDGDDGDERADTDFILGADREGKDVAQYGLVVPPDVTFGATQLDGFDIPGGADDVIVLMGGFDGRLLDSPERDGMVLSIGGSDEKGMATFDTSEISPQDRQYLYQAFGNALAKNARFVDALQRQQRDVAGQEKQLRAYRHYNALDPQLTMKSFSARARSLKVPAPVIGDEGLGRDGFRARYGVNPFMDARFDRFSTFSMAVDKASYTRARERLRAGQLPAPDSIRVEEFVNYFPKKCAATDESVFSVCTEGGPAPFGEGLDLLKITVQARELVAGERRPAVLTFAVDTSGSMHRDGNLRLVAQSLDKLVSGLAAEDQVAVVAYSDQAYVALPHTAARERRRIVDAVSTLTARGGTNIEAGLDLAYRLSDEVLQPKALNRVVLCSDGVANVGARNPQAVLTKIKTFAKRGIYLSVVGFGKERYNDAYLEQLAREGNGNYSYVGTGKDASRVFQGNLPSTLQVLAEDAKIQVEFDPNVVSHYRLLGYEKRDIADKDFRNDKIDAAEVGPGSAVTVLYEVRRKAGAHGDLGRIFVRYRDTRTRQIDEMNFPLPPGVLEPTFKTTSDEFRLIASAAETAELLRRSYWARNGSYARILEVLMSMSHEYKLRPEWRDLVYVVWRAQQLSLAQLSQK